MKSRSKLNEEKRRAVTAFGQFTKKKGKLTAQLTYAQSLELFEQYGDLPELSNKRRIELFKSSDRKDFCGGLTKDLRKPKDLAEYKRQVRELSVSSLARKLDTKLGAITKRRRTTSEHDGEWSLDRQWDLKPFSLATKGPVTARAIEIVADMNFHSGVSSEAISRYGIICAALCGMLEARGFSVSIKARMAGYRFKYGARGEADSDAYEVLTTVKKAGEYTTPQRILGAFSPNYYRRVTFGVINLLADLNDQKATEGLGRLTSEPHSFSYSKGVLGIHSIIKDVSEAEKAGDKLLAAL